MISRISQSILWNDDWQMIQVKRSDYSHKWLFFAMVKKEWYYGEGDSIQQAIDQCGEKIEASDKIKQASIGPKLEELF